MSAYQGFASMYDALMTDAPYDIWVAYIDGFLSNWWNPPKEKPLVLDMACGTGNVTLRLAKLGYELIGVDASVDMLIEAQHKAREQGADILFLAQDMRRLDLYGTVDAVVCVCDGINYILEEPDMLEVFRRVRLFLNLGGVFIFDMNTEYKFKEVFKDQIFEDKGLGGEAYIWENHYDPETRINEYNMLFFDLSGGETYTEPFSEVHVQRAYPTADVCNMLMEAGFASVAVRDGYSGNPPVATSQRVVFIAS